MSVPQIEFAYPASWPEGRPRTPWNERKDALWRHQGARISWDVAIARLREQVDMITRPGQPYRVLEQTLSTNFELRADGRPRRDRGKPSDPAVAFFFELDGKPHVLACDRWIEIADNIAAIAAHIEALRGQERWGVADLRQAFAGHAALPPPEPWWKVLGVSPNTSADHIRSAYRQLAMKAHPDHGGSADAMARLTAARDAGLAQGGNR